MVAGPGGLVGGATCLASGSRVAERPAIVHLREARARRPPDQQCVTSAVTVGTRGVTTRGGAVARGGRAHPGGTSDA